MNHNASLLPAKDVFIWLATSLNRKYFNISICMRFTGLQTVLKQLLINMHKYQQNNTTTKPSNPRDISTKILPLFVPTSSSLPANKFFTNWWLVAAVPCVTASQLIGWGLQTVCIASCERCVQ